MQNKTILLISPEAWGTNFVSKHHYANYLAKENTVYFLNPASTFSKNPFGNVKCEIHKINTNLSTVNYINLLPRLNNLPKIIQKSTYKKQAAQLQKAIGIKQFDIVWSFDPNRFFDQKIWGAKKTIYHTVDFHPNAINEKSLITSSDLCLTISNHIPSLEATKAYDFHTISHGFNTAGKNSLPVTIPGNNKVRAVFVGNIANLLDNTRLNKLAKQNPLVDFVLIGPTKNSNLSKISPNKDLSFHENVYTIGEVAPNAILSYLSKCTINILLLKERKGIENVNSHKLMSYFYSGNVIISDWLLDYEKNDLLIMAKNATEFESKFSQIIRGINTYNSEELKLKRRDFAKENSYDNKIKNISKLLYNNN